MKLVIFADGDVGYDITSFLLEYFLEDLFTVITLRKNRISRLADKFNCPSYQWNNEEELIDFLPRDLDLGLLAWWPRIIKRPLIEIPKNGFINTHPSLLPFNRGKHYNFWTLAEQSPFGVTIHRVDENIDSGEIISQKEINYDWTDTGESLYKKAQNEMLILFKEIYPCLRSLNFSSYPQPNGTGSFHQAKEIDDASRIDLNRKYYARDLLNLLRARTFPPHPGCWFEDNDNCYEISVKIKKVNHE